MKLKRGQTCEVAAKQPVRDFLGHIVASTKLVPVTMTQDLQGVDLLNDEGITFQVKHQKISSRTGNYSFELLQKDVDTGKTLEGNHWHGFHYYVMSADCKYFTIFEPAIVDDFVEVDDDGTYYLTELGKRVGCRLVWNRSTTVERSAQEWNHGRRLTALNVLVPTSFFANEYQTSNVKHA